MPGQRLPMRKIRDVLRLHAGGMSKRKIAASLLIGATAAGDCVRRARRAGLSWPLPENLSDEALERLLYPPPLVAAKDRRAQTDWAAIHRELRRPGVTLQLLWEEHRAVHPEGYGYSRYCELYRAWEANFTYVEATFTQRLVDWINSHVRAFAFFGGVTAQIVSDNLKSGVTKACFYEPAVNRTYAEMAHHYGTAVIPARPRRPKDKSKVEVGVQVATRWVIAKLRNRRFFSLAELNAAIRELVTQLNDRVTRHLGTSRRVLFDDIERPALRKLPVEPYLYAEWKECRVGLDYHVEVERHYYSVPHALLRETVWVRIAASTIEVFHRGNRVAAHMRSSSDRRHTTVREHMPSSHRRYADWTPERIRRQAGEIGRNTAALVETVMRERSHPEQGFRAAVGIIRLVKSYGRDRLEAACGRALEIGARSFTSVNSILKNNLEAKRPAPAADGPPIAHSNIRGSRYFH